MNDNDAKGIAILGTLIISLILATYVCTVVELL